MRRALPFATLLAATTLVAAGGTKAHAEHINGVEYSSADVTPARDGLTFGASIGRGSIGVDCGNCDVTTLREALSISVHAGYMILPRLGIVGEYWSVRHNVRGGAWFDDSEYHLVAQNMTLLGAQVFVTDSIWLKAGIGVGTHVSDEPYAKRKSDRSSTSQAVSNAGDAQNGSSGGMSETPYGSVSEHGAASFLAIGWEFAHNSVFAADVQLRIASTHMPGDDYQVDNTGVNVGFNWY